MKLFLPLCLFLIFSLHSWAQSPQGINYQGVARDVEGKPLVSKPISVRISILKESANGDAEYAETHEVMTNSFGLFTLVIGQGTATTGSFQFVSWAVGNKWLQIELDPTGGNSFQLLGSQQLMSVPYAFYATYSGNGLTAGQGIKIQNNQIVNTGDADNSSSNELITDVSFNSDKKLRITEAGVTKEVDLSALLGASQDLSNVLAIGNDAGGKSIANLAGPTNNSDAATKQYVDNHADADASATNEIQDLALAGNVLKITNNNAATPVDLTPYLDNTDNQNLALAGNTLSIANGNSVNLNPFLDNTDAQTLTVQNVNADTRSIAISGGNSLNFSVADNDNSVTNELQDLALTGNTLSLTGDATAVNLTPYLDNTDNQTISTQSVDANTRSIAISGGNTLNVDVRDADASATNEIQDLSLTGNTLALSGDATPVNLAPYLDNTDNQDLALTGNTLSLSNDATTVSLAAYLDNTDNQNLSLATSGTTRTVSISGGTGVVIDVADNDNSVTNEIQDLSRTGNTLSLSGDATSVDLTPYLDNTDNQNLSLATSGTTRTVSISGGTGVVIDVADNDNIATNEIQDLSLTGNTLSLSGDATTVNLAPYVQTLSYTGATNNLSISGGNSVTISTNLNQVLTTGADAGAHQINNLAAPTANNDATTKKYVDDADAALAARISTTYAFKTAFAYTNSSGSLVNNQTMPFTTEEFDDFNVLAVNSFTATENGVYVFTVDGSYFASSSGGQLSLLYNSVKYPLAIVQPWGSVVARYNATFMFKLTAGQTVQLVGDNILSSGQFQGTFFGYKL